MENHKKYGLIGKKLDHSFSRSYFHKKFAALNIDAEYQNLEISSIKSVSTFLKAGFAGCNVTIPYKEAIIPFLDELSPSAQQVGAVNTIQFKNGKTIGHNTDIFGFKQLIKPFFKSHHERAMILGTGGASKAVAYVLENLGVDLIFISRNPVTKNEFAYADINENMIRFNGIIVNTTPIGMFPNEKAAIPIPYQYLTEKHLAIDLIYNPSETVFLKKAKAQGAWVLNGMTMLQQQAEKSWEIWNQ